MTVSELIERLQQCDPEATVVVPFTFDEVEWGRKVAEEVEDYGPSLERNPDNERLGRIGSNGTEKAVGIW